MSKIIGCYSCGTINGKIDRGRDENPICGECGSPTVLSMLELLDVASSHFRSSGNYDELDELESLHEEYDFDD